MTKKTKKSKSTKRKTKRKGKPRLPKAEVLKARGIRFNDREWKALNKEARKSKVHGSASEIVRELVQRRYRLKRKK